MMRLTCLKLGEKSSQNRMPDAICLPCCLGGSSLLFLSKIIFCDYNRRRTFPPCSEENGVYFRRFSYCLWRHHLIWAKIITFLQGDWIEQAPRSTSERNQDFQSFPNLKDTLLLLLFFTFILLYQFPFGGNTCGWGKTLLFYPLFADVQTWLGQGDDFIRSPRCSMVETMLFKLPLKHSDLFSHISDFG